MRIGGFHLNWSHVRNCFLESRDLIGSIGTDVQREICPYHPLNNSSSLILVIRSILNEFQFASNLQFLDRNKRLMSILSSIANIIDDSSQLFNKKECISEGSRVWSSQFLFFTTR